MASDDLKLAEYHEFQRQKFRIFLNLELTQSDESLDDAEGMRLCLELATAERVDRKLRLEFEGVRGLKLDQPVEAGFSVFPLEIVSIKDQQWEGLAYRVFHDEQDSFISFHCISFSARVVSVEASQA